MRRIIVGAQVSIDGVMQAPGGPTEDPTNGSRVAKNGLVIAHHEREGGIKTGDAPLESPSEREVARRARLKREE